MNSNFGAGSDASVFVERGSSQPSTGLTHLGELHIKVVDPCNVVKAEFDCTNFLTNQGAAYILNRAFSSSQNFAAHDEALQAGLGLYMGLYAGTTPDGSATATTFNGTGFTTLPGINYDEYTGPLRDYNGVLANGAGGAFPIDMAATNTINNTSNAARQVVNSSTLDFLITDGTSSGTATSVTGVYIVNSPDNPNDTGTHAGSFSAATDFCLSVAAFGSPVAVSFDDTIKVTYRHTFAA